MKITIRDKNNKEAGEIELPDQFDEEVRPDIIKRAVLAIQANNRQAYGSAPGAGMRASAELSRRRHDYRGSYGFGISRVPRKIMSRRGTRMNWVGAVVPGTVGGRRAHPPKVEKDWSKDINKKERKKAICSAMAASMQKPLVEQRGHLVPSTYPFAVNDDIEAIKTAKDARNTLLGLGFGKELIRSEKRTIRSGKGTMRNRKYRGVSGPLIVVSSKCNALKAFANIPGCDIELINNLNVELLAPGAAPGRAVLFSAKSLKKLQEENLFI